MIVTRRAARPAARRQVKTAPPLLETGDRLSAREFLRRFDAMPDVKKAELIDGVVYIPLPVRSGARTPPSATPQKAKRQISFFAPHLFVIHIVRRFGARLMNRAILALTFATLSACSTPQPQPKLAQPRSVLPREYVSPDSSFVVRFHVHPRQSHYEFFNRSGNTPHAIAQSRIVAEDFFEGRFRGTQDVIFASDGSGAVITENVSDASQSFRHILITRGLSGSFSVRYLQPPWRRFTTQPVEFSSEPPIATALTADSITFYYPSSRSTLILPLAQVPNTASPKFDPNE